MYDEITAVYEQIFPMNRAFLAFIPTYLGSLGGKVLDLGCGPGDYVDHLTHNGFPATGIDSSAEMIKGAQGGKRGTFFNYSFTEIDQLTDTFNCVFSIGNSLSYLPSNLLKPLFADVYRLLNADGYFVMQVVNWDKYRHTGAMSFDVKTLDDGRTFHRKYQPTPEGTVIFHTELRKGDEIQGSWSDPLGPKLVDDLVMAIQSAGMEIVGQFGDFESSPFDPLSSPATILVAQKVS
ncbi:MAG: class I SAM-dependent methyltransferase [Chloroflexi bacterium]|nr:class I SAM-dependent methyltransferase [Chloroflexota bacterium]